MRLGSSQSIYFCSFSGSGTLAQMVPLTLALTFNPITQTLTLILKHKNVFGKTKWRHFRASVQILFQQHKPNTNRM